MTLEKFACPTSLSCAFRSKSTSFSDIPRLKLKGFLSLSFFGSLPAGCATSSNSIAAILGLAASMTLAHDSQKASICGVGGLASDGEMAKRESRELALRRRWKKVEVMKRANAIIVMNIMRVGRRNMIDFLAAGCHGGMGGWMDYVNATLTRTLYILGTKMTEICP